jgi:hypothetical protein
MTAFLLTAALLQDAPPWSEDVPAARAQALKEGRPCVLILHVDASAL